MGVVLSKFYFAAQGGRVEQKYSICIGVWWLVDSKKEAAHQLYAATLTLSGTGRI
jgi:hypothetical protein